MIIVVDIKEELQKKNKYEKLVSAPFHEPYQFYDFIHNFEYLIFLFVT